MNKKAFTLIELLVVVAVLALLASIVFSNLGGAREGARISNALSFQSQTHSLLGSDLVGWWNFNEGSGTTARDISGYDNHGNIVGATYVDGVPGTGGTALEFDGVDDYVNTNVDLSWTSADSFSMSAWIKTTGESNRLNNIISKNSFEYMLSARDNTIRFIYWNPVGSNVISLSRSIANITQWNFVTVMYDGRDAKLHINGVLEDVNLNISDEFINRSETTKIGTGYNYGSPSSRFFQGLIDDVRIYNRALTASEIQTLYVQTKNKYLVNE